MKTPDRTTAAAFPRYLVGEVVEDSAKLQWAGLFVRRHRFPRVVDYFLVPATPEPLISCGLAGSGEFLEREIGGTWVSRQLQRGHIFVTRSRTPYEVRWSSPPGEELETVTIHVAVDQFRAALESIYPGKAGGMEVVDFFGRDEALAHLSLRPIFMTSFAFILGCLPLWMASGSGAVARRVMSTTVIGGMLAATLIAIFLIPVTYYVVERFAAKRRQPVSPEAPPTQDDGEITA